MAIYAGFTSFFLAGSLAVAVDYGRMAAFKAELQNLADAAAQSGALMLDGTDSAITNATDVATNAISKRSGLNNDSQDDSIGIESITFYSDFSGDSGTTTTDAEEAAYIGVQLSQHQTGLIFYPILRSFIGASGGNTVTLTASAVSAKQFTACGVPPLMMCDLTETMGSSADVRDPANIGRQVKLGKKSGMNQMAPGNFGVLDTTDGSQATQDLAAAMAAVEQDGCYGSSVDTAPGARAEAIRDGINSRFDQPAPPQNFEDPAPNVINYGRDSDINSTSLGSGSWDFADYWADKHPTYSQPSALGSSPSRYQVYLYELGETFAVNGKKTLYPVPDTLPSGYTTITPSNPPGPPVAEKNKNRDDPDYDGVPEENTPVDDPRRRVVEVVILNCISDDVRGNSGPYPLTGRYVELFVTENIDNSHTIYGEIVQGIDSSSSEKLTTDIRLYD